MDAVPQIPTDRAGAPSPHGGAGAVGAVLEKLAAVHGIPAGRVRRIWRAAGEAAFADGAAPSSLCDDGTPFELSVTIAERPGGLRYLTELGDGEPGGRRLADARRKLPALVDLLDLRRRPFLERVDRLLPEPPASFPDLAFGMWVGPVLLPGESRLKVYVNTSWWDVATARERVPWRADLGWRPALVGLEHAVPGPGDVKLYFRGRPLGRERVLALAERADASPLAELWDAFLAGRDLGPGDGILSIRHAGDGRPATVKVDFAAGVLDLPEAEIPDRVEAVARRLGLDPGDYLRTVELGRGFDGGWRHTLVGVTAAGGRPRINVYLKPVLRDARSLVRVVRSVLSTRPAYATAASPPARGGILGLEGGAR